MNAYIAESRRLEYKLTLTDNLEKEAVAFLNADGGQIHFGIRDNGTVVGVADADTMQLQIKDRIINNIRPGTLGLFDLFVEEHDGKQIVVLNLAGGPAVPYYIRKYGRSEKGCFLRVGSAAQPMTEEHIGQLMSRRQPAALTAIASRHQDLTFSQMKIFYESKGILLNHQFAKTLDLTTPDGAFNQLAYLLADVNRVSIRVAKWWGTDKMRLRENEEYGDCSLVKSMQKVLDKFDIENTTQARKRGMKTREELRLVDSASLRELVINAFAHNDYTNGDTPIFEIFSDRFEITSYGGLITGMTQDEFFSGVSKPRNPEIMRIFKDLEYVERLGSGIPPVVRKYGREIFSFSSSVIRFCLPFERMIAAKEQPKNDSVSSHKTPQKIKPKSSVQSSEKSSVQSSEKSSVQSSEKNTAKSSEKNPIFSGKPTKNTENRPVQSSEKSSVQSLVKSSVQSSEKILRLIEKIPTITAKQLAASCGVTPRGMEKTIAQLKTAGIIRRVGPDNGGHWEITK